MIARKINDQELLDKHTAGYTGMELAAYFDCSPAAVSKRLKRLLPRVPRAIDALTPKQAATVKRIAAGESPVNAVSQCYNTTTRASAAELASRITALPQVQLALDEEMNKAGLTRTYRVSKLAEHCENPDPSTSLKALNLAFTLADEMPATKNKSMVITAEATFIDLSKYGMCP